MGESRELFLWISEMMMMMFELNLNSLMKERKIILILS